MTDPDSSPCSAVIHTLRHLGHFATAAAVGVIAAGEAGAVLTGVCPDGSMFIVKREASVPCDRAKLVDPNDMPPLKPELLPRPYAWDRFQREQDPNNPYNLVGTERPALPPRPETAARPTAPSGVPQQTQQAALHPPQQQAAVAVAPGAPRAGEPLALGLSRDDIENLFLIVELAQERAPASFDLPDAEGRAALTLRLAYSRSFEPRLKEFWSRYDAEPEGSVLLFSAVAGAAVDFHANLTFVQGHVAFQPDPGDPRQLGLVSGRFGPQAVGDAVLGFVVLPEHMDPTQPVDIYWDDRLLTASF